MTEDIRRNIYLRYPKPSSKLYIDPSACGLGKGSLYKYTEDFTEVDDPEDADHILVLLGYKDDSDVCKQLMSKYPDKCLSVLNFLETINFDKPSISEEEFNSIIEMLKSTDTENISMGLSILRQSNLDDYNIVSVVHKLFNSLSNDNGNYSIIPLGKHYEDRVTITTDIEPFQYMYLYFAHKIL